MLFCFVFWYPMLPSSLPDTQDGKRTGRKLLLGDDGLGETLKKRSCNDRGGGGGGPSGCIIKLSVLVLF